MRHKLLLLLLLLLTGGVASAQGIILGDGGSFTCSATVTTTPFSLTTTGTGAASYNSTTHVLNVPISGAGGSGTVNAGLASQLAGYVAGGTAVSGISDIPAAITQNGKTICLADGTGGCTGSGGGTVNAGLTNQLAIYPGNGNAVSGTGDIPAATTQGGKAICLADGTNCLATPVTPVAVSISSFTAAANSCYDKTGTLNAVSTASMANLTTAMAPHWSFTSNPKAIAGWGTTAGMNLLAWVSGAGTVSYEVCNQTSGSIVAGAITLNVGAP